MIGKKLYISIAIIIIAIIGLLWGQYIWISNLYNLKNKELTTKALDALKESIKQTEDSYYCIDFFSNNEFTEGEKLVLLRESEKGETDTLDINFWNPAIAGDSVFTYNEITMSFPAKMEMVFHMRYMIDSLSFSEESYVGNENGISHFRHDVKEDEGFIPVFDSILKNNLNKKNIIIDYEYFINYQDKDSIVYKYPESAYQYNNKNVVKSTVFGTSYFFKPYDIRLIFPSRDSYIYSNLLFVIGGTTAFIVILIIFFWIFIRTIIHQKRLAEMKSDFIHNMTHEFKTPLSNVNLALDTIEKKKDDKRNESETKLLKIIRDENIRLQENVNLILNTAFYENKNIDLHKEPVGLNDIISRTIALFDSELMEQRADIESDLQKDLPQVNIDETHFTNVIFNLIDNAIKYAKEAPHIKIRTFAKDKTVVLKIHDNGIGIAPKSIKHIFDKFYRVHTGKVHDVKGFGLGLTYVKYVVDAHQAKINVESKLGSGSTFTISIPIEN